MELDQILQHPDVKEWNRFLLDKSYYPGNRDIADRILESNVESRFERTDKITIALKEAKAARDQNDKQRYNTMMNKAIHNIPIKETVLTTEFHDAFEGINKDKEIIIDLINRLHGMKTGKSVELSYRIALDIDNKELLDAIVPTLETLGILYHVEFHYAKKNDTVNWNRIKKLISEREKSSLTKLEKKEI